MIPFCAICQLLSNWPEDINRNTHRVKEGLHLLHELNHRLAPRVSYERLLRETKTVLGGDTALALLHPLVDPRLQRLLDLLVVPARRDVQVQVRVAHVAVADHVEDRLALVVNADEVELAHAGTAVVDELVQVRQRDGQVVLVDAAEVLAGLGDALAAGPQVLRLCLVLGDHAVCNDLLGHNVLEEGGQLLAVVVRVRAGGLDQAVEGVLVGEGEGFARRTDVELLRFGVHELEGGENLGELALGFAEGFLDVLVGGQAEVGDVDGGGALRAVDGNSGDDANGALATNEELLDVVAGVVLAELGQVVHDGAVRENSLQTEDSAVKRSVAEETQTTSIGRNIATNVAGTLCAEVEREDVATLGEVGVGSFEDNASVGDEDTRDVIEGTDLVHATKVQDDLVEHRHATSDQASIAALGVHGEQVVIAVFHDLRDLLGRLRPDHQLRLATVFLHPVGVEALEVVGRILGEAIDDGALTAQQILEELHILCAKLLEPRVTLNAIGVGGVFDVLLRAVGLGLGRMVDAGS